ncbi:MAG: phosphatase domain-containing protein, partial [Candidatus Nanopelagicales bacterium]
AAVPADAPIEEGIRLLTEAGADHEIVLLSGRPESTRQDTSDWLGRHGVPFDRLVLRRNTDHRPAPVMKAELVGGIAPPDQVAMVVDDDASVVDRLAALGYPALHFDPLG